MATTNLDAANLAAVPVGGTIHEELMNKINNLSPVDRPLIDSIGSAPKPGNTKTDWTREDLAAASPQNKRIDGSSSDGINDTVIGERIGTFHQTMTKTLRVSVRADYSNTIEYKSELAKQLMLRQQELKRDEEARFTSRLVSVPGDGATIAGETAGVGGWIGTGQANQNTNRGATGVDPILSGNPGGYPTTAPVAGTSRAGSETFIRNGIKEAYKRGGAVNLFLSTPDAIGRFSDYLFTSSARVAAIQTDASQSNRINNESGGGRASGGIVAQGSVNVFVSNYATVTLVPDLFQPEVAADVADIYLLDTSLWKTSHMKGYHTYPLAKTGLADNREMMVDTGLICLNEEGNAVVADIDTTLAFVA